MGQEKEELRGVLQAMEQQHAEARDAWQGCVTTLQGVWQRKELADRECQSLKQQLSTQWASWHPMWVQRLHTWRDRVLSLSKAQQDEQRLMEALTRGWDGLRSERALRHE